MNWDAIGAMGQVAGSVAVLVSFIYLARQIKQSAEITRLNMVAAARQQETDFYNTLMGENPSEVVAKAAVRPSELTPGDVGVLLARVSWFTSMMARNAIMEEAGMFDASWRKTMLPGIGRQIAGDPVGKTYLLLQAASSEWMTELQEHVGSLPTGASAAFYESMLEVARAERREP